MGKVTLLLLKLLDGYTLEVKDRRGRTRAILRVSVEMPKPKSRSWFQALCRPVQECTRSLVEGASVALRRFPEA